MKVCSREGNKKKKKKVFVVTQHFKMKLSLVLMLFVVKMCFSYRIAGKSAFWFLYIVLWLMYIACDTV